MTVIAGQEEKEQVQGITTMSLAELEQNAMAICPNWECSARKAYGKVTDNARVPCTMSVEPDEEDRRDGWYFDPTFKEKAHNPNITPLEVLEYNRDVAERGLSGHPRVPKAVIRLKCKTCDRKMHDVPAADTKQALYHKIREIYTHDTKTLKLLYQPGKGGLPDDAWKVCDMAMQVPAAELLTPRTLECIERSLQSGRLKEKLEEKGLTAREKFGSEKKTYIRIALGVKALGSHIAILELWPKGYSSPIHHHGGCAGSVRVVHGTLDVQIFKSLIDPEPMRWKNGDAGLTGLPSEGTTTLQLPAGQTTWLNRSNFWTHAVECNSESPGGFALSVHLYKSCTDEFAMISQQQPKLSGPKSDYVWDVDTTQGDEAYIALQKIKEEDRPGDFQEDILNFEASQLGPHVDPQASSEVASREEAKSSWESLDEKTRDVVQKAVKSGSREWVDHAFGEAAKEIGVADGYSDPGLSHHLLELAAESGSKDVFQLILEKAKSDHESVDEKARAVLAKAVKSGSRDLVDYVFKQEIDIAGDFSDTGLCDQLLELAAERGSKGAVKVLLDKGCCSKKAVRSAGVTAEVRNFPDVTDLLLPSVSQQVGNERGSLPSNLFRAVEDDNLEALILAARQVGANTLMVEDSDGGLLHKAASKGHKELARFLIEKGADVNQKGGMFGLTPLNYAAENGHIEIAKFLVDEKGADVNQQDNDGWTPLHWAAQFGHAEVVRFLVDEKGADVNRQDNDGGTPLHLAALEGQIEVVRFLVEEKGADVNRQDNDGGTPLHWASQRGFFEVVRILVEAKGADVIRQDNDGWTPLHLAAQEGHLEVVRLLVDEKGADVNLTNKQGQTPLQLAEEPPPFYFDETRKRGKVEIAAFLRARAAHR